MFVGQDDQVGGHQCQNPLGVELFTLMFTLTKGHLLVRMGRICRAKFGKDGRLLTASCQIMMIPRIQSIT
jgi:hypothetical protein